MQLYGGKSHKEYTLEHGNTLEGSWVNLNQTQPIEIQRSTVPVSEADKRAESFCYNVGKVITIVSIVFFLLCIQSTAIEKRHQKEMDELKTKLKAEQNAFQVATSIKFDTMHNAIEDLQIRFARYDKTDESFNRVAADVSYFWNTVAKEQLMIFVKNGGMVNPKKGFKAVEASVRDIVKNKVNTMIAEALGIPEEALQMLAATLPSIEEMATSFPINGLLVPSTPGPNGVPRFEVKEYPYSGN